MRTTLNRGCRKTVSRADATAARDNGPIPLRLSRMPFTFFAHQAPVLPVARRWPNATDGVALVIGSMAPDLAYLLNGSRFAIWAHAFPWLVTFCVPVTICLSWIVVRVLAPVVPAHLPQLGNFRLQDYRGLATHRFGIVSTPVCAFVGALSHVAFDSLTPRMGLGRPKRRLVRRRHHRGRLVRSAADGLPDAPVPRTRRRHRALHLDALVLRQTGLDDRPRRARTRPSHGVERSGAGVGGGGRTDRNAGLDRSGFGGVRHGPAADHRRRLRRHDRRCARHSRVAGRQRHLEHHEQRSKPTDGYGVHPSGASSNPSNTKPGVTTQLTSVHAPSGVADCQAPAGTTTCGR